MEGDVLSQSIPGKTLIRGQGQRQLPEVSALPPEEPITDEQIEGLLSTVTRYNPPVELSEFIKTRLRDYIRDNWLTRPGHKSYGQLIVEMEHPCMEEWFHKNMAGENNFNKSIDVLRGYLNSSTGGRKDQFQSLIDIRINKTAEFFLEGFFTILKENLVFENGTPIGVRPVDIPRFGKCNEVLTRQKAARNAVAPRGIDETEKAFALRKVRPVAQVIRDFKEEQRRQQQTARNAEFTARAARIVAERTANVARRTADAAAKIKEGAARTIAIDLVEIPLSYLPKKTMFSNPRVTFIYQSLMGRINEELVKILVTNNESEFAALKEKYARELRSDCFQDLLISTINQIINSKDETQANINKQIKARYIANVIANGVVTTLGDNIEFLGSPEPLPVKFKEGMANDYAKCEASFQKVSPDKIIETVLSLDTSNITIDKIQYYRGLIDAVRRWYFAEYKKAGSPFRLAIDAVADKLTQRELTIQYQSAATASTYRPNSVRSIVQEQIMAAIDSFVELQKPTIKDMYNKIKVGLKTEIEKIILGATQERPVPPSVTIIEHLDSKCFQEYFIDYLTLFNSPMRENLDKKLVDPFITRIKQLANVIVHGFTKSFSDKMARKNNSVVGIADPELKRKYPKCQTSLQHRYADSETIARTGYSVLPSVSIFAKSPQQKLYNNNLLAIISKINEILPVLYDMNAILMRIKSVNFKTELNRFLSEQDATSTDFIRNLANSLVHEYIPEGSPASTASWPNSLASHRSFFDPTPAPARNRILPTAASSGNMGGFNPHAAYSREPSAHSMGGPLYNAEGGRRSHKKSQQRVRGHVTRRGRRAHVVLRGPRTTTVKGKKNGSRSARRTRRRSSS